MKDTIQRIDITPHRAMLFLNNYLDDGTICVREQLDIRLIEYSPTRWTNVPYEDKESRLTFVRGFMPYMADAVITEVTSLPEGTLEQFRTEGLRLINRLKEIEQACDYYEWEYDDYDEKELFTRVTISLHDLLVVNGRVKADHSYTKRRAKKIKPIHYAKFQSIFDDFTQ